MQAAQDIRKLAFLLRGNAYRFGLLPLARKFVHTTSFLRAEVQDLAWKEQDMASAWQDSLTGTDLSGPRQSTWWTGTKPHETPGFGADGSVTSLQLPNLKTVTRAEILRYFENTWALTEILFSSLNGEEGFYIPPAHDLRHPMIFYYGHVACFYINKLVVAGLLDTNINNFFENIFEQGVDEMAWDDLSKNHKIWPSVDEVREYRQKAYDIVKNLILTHPSFDSLADELWDSPFWTIPMAMEHERIHLETSSVLIRQLPTHLVAKPANWADYYPTSFEVTNNPITGKHYPTNDFISVDGGPIQLGKKLSEPTYGWDNEYGEKNMDVKPFEATKYKISNGEYLEFMIDDGYLRQDIWSKIGWNWRCYGNFKHPEFWVRDGPQGSNKFKLRHLFDEGSMPWSWPVEVNKHEADAYCRWLSIKNGEMDIHRVITAAEHVMIRDESLSSTDPVANSDGRDFQKKCGLNLAYGSPNPVDAFPPSSSGFYDVFGSVWEWCEDNGSALPDFQVHPYYNDFSVPTFDGQHWQIMGGSFMSTGSSASKYGRYCFRAHFHQHSGFRVVRTNEALVTSCMDNQGPFGTQGAENPYRSLPSDLSGNKKYDLDSWLGKYIHLHFPPLDNPDAIPSFLPKEALNFPLKCAEVLIAKSKELGTGNVSALDIGCAVGGSSFALASHYQNVRAMDITEIFIDAANELKETGKIDYEVVHEGHVNLPLVAIQDDTELSSRVTFEVGDAMKLPSDIGQVDAVLMANVICRLPNPRKCLRRLGGKNGIIRPGGLLMLTTPFSWDENFTPSETWIGGTVNTSDQAVSSLKELQKVLEDEQTGFELIHSSDMPLVIRNHYRHYEFPVAYATVWRNAS